MTQNVISSARFYKRPPENLFIVRNYDEDFAMIILMRQGVNWYRINSRFKPCFCWLIRKSNPSGSSALFWRTGINFFQLLQDELNPLCEFAQTKSFVSPQIVTQFTGETDSSVYF
jgi:hypothetical protein